MAADAHRAPGMTRGALRATVTLGLALAVVAAASPVFTVAYADHDSARQDATITRLDATIAQLRSQQLAGCAFAAHLGSAALPDRPRPGRLGVQLVTDSRAQWRALHCPGSLPPGTGLAKWAAYYHLDSR